MSMLLQRPPAPSANICLITAAFSSGIPRPAVFADAGGLFTRARPALTMNVPMVSAVMQIRLRRGTWASNDIIWDHKLNARPSVDADGHLVSFVFRRTMTSTRATPGAAGRQKALCGGRRHQHPGL